MKTCPICKEAKELTEYDHYWSNERNKYRPQNYCRECCKAEQNRRAAEYFQKHRDERLQYAKEYRAKNKATIQKKKLVYRTRYRQELKDCYVREVLKDKDGIPTEMSRQNPELVMVKRTQIQLNRKLKTIKNEK